MKNFRIIQPEKLKDAANYQFIEEGVYNDLNDDGGYATYRIAMAMEAEEGDDSQYPLEDILDEYLVHVEEFLDDAADGSQQYIFGGELKHIQNFKTIIG